MLLHSNVFLTPAQESNVFGILKYHNICELGDFWDRERGWRPISSFRVSTKTTRQGHDQGLSWLLNQVECLVEPMVNFPLHKSNGWLWKVGNKVVHS